MKEDAAYSLATWIVMVVGFLIGGVMGAFKSLLGFLALAAVLAVGAPLVYIAVVVLWLTGVTVTACTSGLIRGLTDSEGGPVVTGGVLLIGATLVALTVTGNGLLALAIGIGLPVGFWYWKRPTITVA